MGEMKRAEARYKAEFHANRERYASTLVIGACVIAAVRLAREQGVDKPTPRVLAVVIESVGLARLILAKVLE